LRLNLGCGHDYLEGWVNIDAPRDELCYEDLRADVYSRIEDLEYPECSAEEIQMIAVLEHFPRHIAIVQLRRVYKWLTAGGRLTVVVPDFSASVKMLQRSQSAPERMFWWRHIFGPQDTIAYGTHYDGFDEEKLRFMFATVGFDACACMKDGNWPNLRFTGVKRPPFMSEEEAQDNILRYIAMYAAKGETRTFIAWVAAMGFGQVAKPETPDFETQRQSTIRMGWRKLRRALFALQVRFFS
jgi:hypothetical protein